MKPLPPKPKPVFHKHTIRNLNTHAADFDQINQHLKTVDWNELRSLCTEQEFPELIRLTILQICEIYTTSKSSNKRRTNKYVKERKTLNRKRRRLNLRLVNARRNKHVPSNKVASIERDLSKVTDSIKQSLLKQKEAAEKRAVEVVSENPSYFFSYSKRFAKQPSTIGPLLDKSNSLQQSSKKMADLLQDQYSSVFSTPSTSSESNPNAAQEETPVMEEIIFSQDDVISAIKETGTHSASAEDDIPSVMNG